MKVIYSNWSKNVKKAMIDADLDTNDIAAKFNWTRQYVSSIINGRTYQREAVINISLYLGIEIPESPSSTLAKKKKVIENRVEENLVDESRNYYGSNTKLIPNRLLTELSEGKSVREAIPRPIPGEGRQIRIGEGI